MTTAKQGFYSILALVSLLGLGITQSARANLITNGGFETGDFSGWTVFGTDNDVVGAEPFTLPHSGKFQALFGFATLDGEEDRGLGHLEGVLDGIRRRSGGWIRGRDGAKPRLFDLGERKQEGGRRAGILE